MAAGLLIASALNLLAFASFAFVARVLVRRFARGEDAGVVRIFATFWGAMAVVMLQRAFLGVAASMDWTPLPVFLAARFVEIAVVSVAAWGLSFYVAFLYTGRNGLRFALGLYFAVVGLAYGAATEAAHVTGVDVGPFETGLTPETPYIDYILAAYGVPLLVSTAAYLSLVGQVMLPIQRYRITLVSSSLLAWVASGLVANIIGDPFWSFATITVLGLVTAAAVFLAYRPPRFVLRRWAPEDLAAADEDPVQEPPVMLAPRFLNVV